MSIIGKVGRRSFKIRALNTLIHIVLLLGAVTMIYPFLLMLSSSVKSAVDSNRMSLFPQYLVDDSALYQKYLEARYNEESNRLGDNYAGRWLSFAEVRMPQQPNQALMADWSDFLAANQHGYDEYTYYVSEQYGRGVYPRNQRLMRAQLRDESDGDLSIFNRKYSTGVQSWEQIVIEENAILGRGFVSGDHGYLGRYREFKRAIALWHRDYVNIDGSFVRIELIPEFKGDIRAFNRAMGTDFADWNAITLPQSCPEEGSALAGLRPFWLHYVKDVLNVHHIWLNPSAETAYAQMLRGRGAELPEGESAIPKIIPDSGRIVDDYTFFIENIARPEDLIVRTIGNDFRAWLRGKYGDIDALNSQWQNELVSFESIRLSESLPHSSIYAQDDWLEYVKEHALEQLTILPAAQAEYVSYLRISYADSVGTLDLKALNNDLGTDYDDEINIFAPEKLPEHPRLRELWTGFVRGQVSPLHMKLIVTPAGEREYTLFLQNKYGSISELNQAWHLRHASFESIPYPIDQIDYLAFSQNVPGIRWEFFKRNYVMVLDQMLNDARSLRNTLIYTLLSILLAITVNPLAAYALSRFKPRFGYQLIMLFMLTMAFPAMVMGIPNFLMLKRLNMLNTFWALILPAAADGYFIFLLKGFFDSLPRELYESARLDGAGEFRLFWQFTLYLSKPILAVIALGAFNAAYRNFLFAFIVCQDQSMWTLMVHIYELMQRASPSVGYAALVIAAIPTLAVFIFFQNIIIKGIVVPMEK